MLRVRTVKSNQKALESWTTPLPYVMNAELRQRNIEKTLFADWPGMAVEVGRVNHQQESLLFKQLNYCGHKLSQLYRAAQRKVTSRLKRDYAKWTKRSQLIRSRLTEANLGLVYQMVGRSRFDNLEREEMNAEGMMALLRAIDSFDPWRGYRFSTYACNAILRGFVRMAKDESKRTHKLVGSYDPIFDDGDLLEVRHDDQLELYLERLDRTLSANVANLTESEQNVLFRRFPSETGEKPQTLETIGKILNVSKERVRQIQISAIGKLRNIMTEDLILQ